MEIGEPVPGVGSRRRIGSELDQIKSEHEFSTMLRTTRHVTVSPFSKVLPVIR